MRLELEIVWLSWEAGDLANSVVTTLATIMNYKQAKNNAMLLRGVMIWWLHT